MRNGKHYVDELVPLPHLMSALFKYMWAGLFLAVMGFQITGTTLHFYDRAECTSQSSHHEEGALSLSDHCKICDNLSLLQGGFEVPSAIEFTHFTTTTGTSYFFISNEEPAQKILSCYLRGPPALNVFTA